MKFFKNLVFIFCLGVLCSCTSSKKETPVAEQEKIQEKQILIVSNNLMNEQNEHISIIGRLEAYGNAPHIVWMIRSNTGDLYYPEQSYQKALSQLGTGDLYKWFGIVSEAKKPLPGLIPQHKAVLLDLSWEKVE